GQVFLAAGHVPPGAGQRLRVRARGCGDLSQEWTGVPVSDGVNVYWIRLLPGRTGGAWSPPGPGAPTLTTNPRKEPPP
ncbi:MAG: hypothetical protein HY721_24665, partial [Planctomycetes bacterium]|nr:hypothetical protein [Planctomycetota bacterium]